jgi:hypothetical protein
MSRWTTLPLSLILLSLSAGVAAAADDLPRNIELKPGAVAPDGQTAADTSTSEDKTRQIVTEPAAAAPTDAAGKPDTPKEGEGASVATPAVPADKATPPEAPAASRRKRRLLRRPRPDPLQSLFARKSLRSRCRPSSNVSAAIRAMSMACGAAARARRSPRSAISPRSMWRSLRLRLRSSPSSRARTRPSASRQAKRILLLAKARLRLRLHHPTTAAAITAGVGTSSLPACARALGGSPCR